MTLTLNPDASRFLRTLRVATATALAGANLAGDARARAATTFLALAAKGREDWRFPAEGLTSADGLVRASLDFTARGHALVLQALGAAGLTRYAEARVRVKLGDGRSLEGTFDHDGRLNLPLDVARASESDLAGFDIEFADDAP